jgi:NAD(P)-dependent dehydrogenase (short-subunit alcohol dehydrogenase family)
MPRKARCGSIPRPRRCVTARPGCRVNTVHPGYMPPMLNATNADEREDKIAATPLRRIGKPIEVAYGVLFLASGEASFVTGTELVIDGGFIAH